MGMVLKPCWDDDDDDDDDDYYYDIHRDRHQYYHNLIQPACLCSITKELLTNETIARAMSKCTTKFWSGDDL